MIESFLSTSLDTSLVREGNAKGKTIYKTMNRKNRKKLAKCKQAGINSSCHEEAIIFTFGNFHVAKQEDIKLIWKAENLGETQHLQKKKEELTERLSEETGQRSFSRSAKEKFKHEAKTIYTSFTFHKIVPPSENPPLSEHFSQN